MHLQQRILVTGGAEFLGSHLCERLLAEGGDVLCADNFFTGTRKNIEQKAEIDDTRASLSYKLKRTLQMCARKVLTTGPFVTTDPHILPLEQVVERSDILNLCTPHSVYAEADLKGKPVVDVWGFLKNANVVY